MGDKVYLGDAVYAEVEGGQLILTVDYGEGAVERIAVEPEVWERLVTYVQTGKGLPAVRG